MSIQDAFDLVALHLKVCVILICLRQLYINLNNKNEKKLKQYFHSKTDFKSWYHIASYRSFQTFLKPSVYLQTPPNISVSRNPLQLFELSKLSVLVSFHQLLKSIQHTTGSLNRIYFWQKDICL